MYAAANVAIRTPLGFDPLEAVIIRKGIKHNSLYDSLQTLLQDMKQTRLPPDVLIIHAGTTDLLNQEVEAIRASFQCQLEEIIRRRPAMTILWSDVIPPLKSPKGIDLEAMNNARDRINRMAGALVARYGGCRINHNIGPHRPSLYHRAVDDQLAPLGSEILMINWWNAIRSALEEPVAWEKS